MKNEAKFLKMMERYIFAIDKIKDSDFKSHSVHQMTKHKIYRAQSGHTIWKLCDNFIEVKSKCRTLAAQLPHNISNITSGKQLNSTHNMFLTN